MTAGWRRLAEALRQRTSAKSRELIPSSTRTFPWLSFPFALIILLAFWPVGEAFSCRPGGLSAFFAPVSPTFGGLKEPYFYGQS